MIRPSYSAIVAHLALAVALSTGAAAAVVITGSSVKDGSLTGADVRNGSLTGVDIRNGSLTGVDVKAGTLTGKQVKKGSIPVDRLVGAVPMDTTRFYDKSQSDARFLGVGATATNAVTAGNASQLGGLPASAYAKGKATFYSGTATAQLSVPGSPDILVVPGIASVQILNCAGAVANFAVVNLASDAGGPLYYETPAMSNGFVGAGWVSIGSATTPGTWGRFTVVQGSGASAKTTEIEVRSGLAGSTCSFVATATVYG